MKIFLCFGILLLLLTSCLSSRRLLRSSADRLVSAPVLEQAHVGISIYDAGSNRFLYNHQAEKYFVPASNVKLLTCYAAMKYLGDSLPGLRYQEDNNGTVTVSGTGDPSFLHPDYPDQPVYDFLKMHKRIDWRSPIFEQTLGAGWSWDDYTDDYMVQRSLFPIYGNVVRFGLDRAGRPSAIPRSFSEGIRESGEGLTGGFDVFRNWDSNVFNVLPGRHSTQTVPFNSNPGTVRELLADTLHIPVDLDPFGGLTAGRILHSRPTDSLLRPMMFRSDNFYAEQVLLMLGSLSGSAPDVNQVIDSLLITDLADLPQVPRWVDGSGLSRYNLFSPLDFIAVLRKMLSLPDGRGRMKRLLPSGGQGTLAGYYVSGDGSIFAKTGSMSGVICISGLLYTKHGKELLFSVLVNNHHGSGTAVRRSVEAFLRELQMRE